MPFLHKLATRKCHSYTSWQHRNAIPTQVGSTKMPFLHKLATQKCHSYTSWQHRNAIPMWVGNTQISFLRKVAPHCFPACPATRRTERFFRFFYFKPKRFTRQKRQQHTSELTLWSAFSRFSFMWYAMNHYHPNQHCTAAFLKQNTPRSFKATCKRKVSSQTSLPPPTVPHC